MTPIINNWKRDWQTLWIKPVEVLNVGVGGWGTDQQAIFYLAEGFRYQPDVVLLGLSLSAMMRSTIMDH